MLSPCTHRQIDTWYILFIVSCKYLLRGGDRPGAHPDADGVHPGIQQRQRLAARHHVAADHVDLRVLRLDVADLTIRVEGWVCRVDIQFGWLGYKKKKKNGKPTSAREADLD